MMKRIVSMLLLTGTLLIGNTVFAFYADESSAVNLGMVQSYSRSAINVIDDSGAGLTVTVGYDVTGGMTYGLSQIW